MFVFSCLLFVDCVVFVSLKAELFERTASGRGQDRRGNHRSAATPRN